ncbi:MAG: enoyl-CoA hydratase/isomerase family protein [Deltaproteobacteria bacterium]|nr:enoyl-CoA hydratase/isomerase family protein [Deltaproteobacteria bacterium]
MITLEKSGDVFILHMVAGENRYNAQFISSFNQALDEVERSQGPAALVTVGENKFYSNGLDLDWMNQQSPAVLREHVDNVHKTMLRVLTLPMITVAALNGHVFAAGAMVALAHDFRVMRADRGYFCLPEADIKIPFTKSMDALLRACLPVATAREAMCTAKRYGAIEAVEQQIVHHAVAENEVLPKAVEIAQSLAAKDRETLSVIKRRMYAEVIEVFKNDVPE